MLKIEHLTKTYGGKPAVQDLCLHIRPGELCAFIGHNGAGKTTTLKCWCGIQQFDAGEIYVDGISVREDPLECKRRLAYLPDDPQLYDYMTGIQYLDFIADIFGVSTAQRAQRIRQYGDAFGLTQDLAQSIGAYSHGMKQKLAIIAALLHEPKLILMDEPFVGLDPLASHQLKNQMKAFCAQGGAIFFSTHVLEVAEKLCDRVAILRKGQLVREGAMEEVRGDDTLEEVFLELEDTGKRYDPCIAQKTATGTGCGLCAQQQNWQAALPGRSIRVCIAVCGADAAGHAQLWLYGAAAGSDAGSAGAGLALFCADGAFGADGQCAGQCLYQLRAFVPLPG